MQDGSFGEACEGTPASKGSVLSILSLAAAPGTVLRIRAVGTDAEEAVAALGAILESPAEPAATN